MTDWFNDWLITTNWLIEILIHQLVPPPVNNWTICDISCFHFQIPERENTTSIVVTTAGIVLGIVMLGAVVGIVVIKHIRSNRDGINVDSLDEQIYTASSRRSSFTTSEDEVELTEADFEDELVEDQYLPSDSELKSGLELMFLKQQRHYWTRKKKPW